MSCKVYVGNLGENGDRDTLEQEFSKFGPVQNVWVAKNPPGFAFVFYRNPEDAEEAARLMNNQRVCGVKIRVELSHQSEERNPPGEDDKGGRGRGMAKGRARDMSRDVSERRPGPRERFTADPLRDGSARDPGFSRPAGLFDRRSPPLRRTPPLKYSGRESPPRGSRRSFQEGPALPQRSPLRMGRARPSSPRDFGFEPPRSRMSPRREGHRASSSGLPPRRPPAYDPSPRGQFSSRQGPPFGAERPSLKRPATARSPPRELLFKRSPPRRGHSFEFPGEMEPSRNLNAHDFPRSSRLLRRSPPARNSFDHGHKFESRERNHPPVPHRNRSPPGRRADQYNENGFSDHPGPRTNGRRQQDLAPGRPARDFRNSYEDEAYEREFSRVPKRSSNGPGVQRQFDGSSERFSLPGERAPRGVPLLGGRLSQRPAPSRQGDRPSGRGNFQRNRSPLR